MTGEFLGSKEKRREEKGTGRKDKKGLSIEIRILKKKSPVEYWSRKTPPYSLPVTTNRRVDERPYLQSLFLHLNNIHFS